MKHYWDSLTSQERSQLANKVGSTSGYLRLIFTGHKKAGFSLAKKLEIETNGAVSKAELRPDIYTATESKPDAE